MPTPYDKFPYLCRYYPNSDISNLAAIGQFFKFSPASHHKAKVLELGCAGGANIITMGGMYPGSKFVGIDASEVQIQAGKDHLKENEVKNVKLRALTFEEALDTDLGYKQFDYIIAHGIYSWTPKKVRDQLFELILTKLAPKGIAYVSYNVKPGWDIAGALRDMLLYHTSKIKDPQEKVSQSRSFLKFIAEHTPVGMYKDLLNAELAVLGGYHDSHLFHDHLEKVNEPVFFRDFANHAGEHQLAYLGDAELHMMFVGNLAPGFVEKVKDIQNDIVTVEQYMDFVRNRRFRSSLLIHSDQTVNRSMAAEDLDNFKLSCNVEEREEDGATVFFNRFATIKVIPSQQLEEMKVIAKLKEPTPTTDVRKVILKETGVDAVSINLLRMVLAGLCRIHPLD